MTRLCLHAGRTSRPIDNDDLPRKFRRKHVNLLLNPCGNFMLSLLDPDRQVRGYDGKCGRLPGSQKVVNCEQFSGEPVRYIIQKPIG
jgi:hypothetical protein